MEENKYKSLLARYFRVEGDEELDEDDLWIAFKALYNADAESNSKE